MANRALAAKAERAARQNRELAAVEYSKPFYMTRKPEIPAYDPTIVKRAESPKAKTIKRRYVNAKPAPLVRTGLIASMIGDAPAFRLIKRR